MPTTENFRRAQFQSDLLLFRTFAQSSGLLAENAMSAMLCFSLVATRFVDDFEQDPNTNPYEMLLQAGEARARIEAVVGELESALEHLRRLPLRLDPDGVNPDGDDEAEPYEPMADEPAAEAPESTSAGTPGAAPPDPDAPSRRRRSKRARPTGVQSPASEASAPANGTAEPERPDEGTPAPKAKPDPEDDHD